MIETPEGFFDVQFFSILIGGAICIFSLKYSMSSEIRRLAERRIARIWSRKSGKNIPCEDLPSIVRGRLFTIKGKKERGSVFGRVLAFIDTLEKGSGIKIFSSKVLIISSCAFLTFFVFFYKVFDIGLLGSFFVASINSFFVPFLFLTAVQRKRLRSFKELFPDALDLVVRSIRAGLPVSEAVRVVGSEVAEPVGGAFREIAANMAIGMTLEEALALLQRGVPVSEVRYFSVSLSIQQETGGNLAEILSNLSSIMRKRGQVAKKVKALSSEAKASAIIVGSLPFVVGSAIYVLNKEYIEVLFFDKVGQWFLFGALASVAFGAFVMSRMIRFEI